MPHWQQLPFDWQRRVVVVVAAAAAVEDVQLMHVVAAQLAAVVVAAAVAVLSRPKSPQSPVRSVDYQTGRMKYQDSLRSSVVAYQLRPVVA